MDKSAQQTIHRSTLVKKEPKNLSPRQADHEMYFQLRTIPVSDGYLDKLACRLIEWARNNNNALVLEQFLVENNLSWDTFLRWKNRHERLGQAHQFAKTCLSARREVGGLKNTLNSAMVMKTMPMYSEQWLELTKWYEKLKEGSESRGSNITVVMEPIPSIEDQK
jgi:hypothetical protein